MRIRVIREIGKPRSPPAGVFYASGHVKIALARGALTASIGRGASASVGALFVDDPITTVIDPLTRASPFSLEGPYFYAEG